MKLKSRPELPLVMFRRVLPEWLGAGGECFIEVDARAGGQVNPVYVAALDALQLKAALMDRRATRVTDDETFIAQNWEDRIELTEAGFAAIYDTCVLAWRTNIIDGDAPMKCNRASFMELVAVRNPEITAALTAMRDEVMGAGKIVSEADAATIKN